MIRNGRKIMKPIWKAIFSSLSINAGTKCTGVSSSTEAGSGALASSWIRRRSDSWVWRTMKSRTGTQPFTAACSLSVGNSFLYPQSYWSRASR
ncbi:hypothetical protein D3C79_947340 [compost metagenome]